MSSIPDRTSLSYRKKSSALIFNSDNKLLLVQPISYSETQWNVPGGGIEEGETSAEAVMRELLEELGTDLFEILEESPIQNIYDFPDDVLVRVMSDGRLHRGQHQTQFIVRFLGDDTDIQLQAEELRRHMWVDYHDLEAYLLFPNQLVNIQKVIASSDAVRHVTLKKE